MISSDIRMGLYLLTEELNSLSVKYTRELKDHYRSNSLLTHIVTIASKGSINPTEDSLNLQLQLNNVNPMLITQVLETYKTLDRMKITVEGVRKYFKNLITTRLLDKIPQDNVDDYMREVEKINNLDFGEVSSVSKSIKRKKFNELDIEAMKDALNNAVPSFWKPLNESNPYKGYRTEQLITICGGPGSGKSLFCMQELICNLKMKRPCVYCAIGDLIEEDFLVRLSALYFNVPISDIFLDLDYYKTKLCNSLPNLGEDLDLLFIKPGAVSADELRDYLESNKLLDRSITLFIDYDSNLSGAENLYMKGDEIYCVAEDIAGRNGNLVFIVTQPKLFAYASEKFGMEGLGESSRKNHISATIITIGKNPMSVNPIGYITIAKQRRGLLFSAPYFRDVNGAFIPINEQSKSEIALSPQRRTIICNTSDIVRYENPVLEEPNELKSIIEGK